jgi:hypothetical protein
MYKNIQNVKFYSQMVDYKGEDSGFPSIEEKEKWEDNACGIACIRMIINTFLQKDGMEKGYWELLDLAVKNNAYIEKGWIHHKLLEILLLHGLNGQCHRDKTVKDLAGAIDSGSICIASITKRFIGGQLDDNGLIRARGGHLVVAFDTYYADGNLEAIICHHPSSLEEWNKAQWSVDVERWTASFSGNFIEVFFDWSKV